MDTEGPLAGAFFLLDVELNLVEHVEDARHLVFYGVGHFFPAGVSLFLAGPLKGLLERSQGGHNYCTIFGREGNPRLLWCGHVYILSSVVYAELRTCELYHERELLQ